MSSQNDPIATDPDDEIFARILDELDRGHGPADLERRYCDDFPGLAERIRQFLRRHHALELVSEAEPEGPPVPDRLGDFRIVREIGRGGMGMIYEAIQEPFLRRVALKTIRGDYAHRSPDAEERFRREQEVLARLHHTHIVPIFAAGRHGPLQYYAMEFIQGAALSQMVRTARSLQSSSPGSDLPSLAELAGSGGGDRASGPAAQAPATVAGIGRGPGPAADDPPPRVVLSAKYLRSVATVMRDAADALHHAHEAGVIHRDLKPLNLMVDAREHCRVLDFGLAAYHATRGPATLGEDPIDGPARTAGGLKGTPQYMAPEQFDGEADARSDVWGLGVTLYEMLTLRPAFAGNGSDVRVWRERIKTMDPPSIEGLAAGVPADLAAICRKALRRVPDERYQTAGALAADLGRWLEGEPVKARPAWALRRAALWSRRNKGWAAAILMTLASMAVLALGGLAVAQGAREREQSRLRESLLLKIQRHRTLAQEQGWSGIVWTLVQETARIRPGPDLQSQAVAALAGLDARKERSTELAATALAFDPDPRHPGLWIAERSGTVSFWDDPIGPPQPTASLGAGPFAFRRDGTALQLDRCDLDGSSLLLFAARDGRLVQSFRPPSPGPAEFIDLAISPDGSHVAASVGMARDDGEGQHRVIVWEAGTGRVALNVATTRPTAIALAEGGALVAAGSEGGTLTAWAVPDGEVIGRFVAGHTRINCLRFGRDLRQRLGDGADGRPGGGWLLAAGDAGSDVTIWSLRDRTLSSRYRGSQYQVYVLEFSPDGMTLASGGRFEAKLWDLASGRLLLDVREGNYLHALAFSPDGRKLAVAWDNEFRDPPDRAVSIWAIENGRGIRTLRGPGGQVETLAFSGDGARLAALTQAWQVGVWDRAEGRLIRLLDVPPAEFIDSAGIALSADGGRLVFSAGREARLWDLDSGAEIGAWRFPAEGLVDRVCFLGPDRLLVGRSEPRDARQVFVIRELSGRDQAGPLSVIEDFGAYIHTASLSPDGAFVAVEGIGAGDAGRRVRSIGVYEARTGKESWPLPSQQVVDSLGAGLRFDPTGKILAASLSRGVVTLLDVPARTSLGRLDPPSFILAPGARRWLAGTGESGDRLAGLSLFERGRGAPLMTFVQDHQGDWPHCFSQDGLHIAFGYPDGSVCVADLAKIRSELEAIGLGW